MAYESVVVILATGAAGEAMLERDALDALDETTVTWSRLECEGRVRCLAARMTHAEPTVEFRIRVRQWVGGRGWGVTVAPCGQDC